MKNIEFGSRTLLEDLAEKQASQLARAAFDSQQSALVRDLNTSITRTRASTQRAANRAREIIGNGQLAVAQSVGQKLESIIHEAHNKSYDMLHTFMKQNEPGRTVLDDAHTRHRLTSQRAIQHVGTMRQYLAQWSLEATETVHKAVRQSLREGEVPRLMVQTVSSAVNRTFYQVERIARTETSIAYNNVQNDGINMLVHQFPDMKKRWTELIDDVTGRPFDNAVAADSFAMHGLIATPSGQFTMPNDESVDSRRWGHTYAAPPNRPNDRAVLTPWRSNWKVPGFVVRDGVKVPYTQTGE